MKHLSSIILLALAGCSSLQHAGVASYNVKPIVVKGETICCEVAIHNGKEIGRLDALVEKRADGYTVHLQEWRVNAFAGQRIAAETVTATASTAAKAVAGIMIAPAGVASLLSVSKP